VHLVVSLWLSSTTPSSVACAAYVFNWCIGLRLGPEVPSMHSQERLVLQASSARKQPTLFVLVVLVFFSLGSGAGIIIEHQACRYLPSYELFCKVRYHLVGQWLHRPRPHCTTLRPLRQLYARKRLCTSLNQPQWRNVTESHDFILVSG